MLYVVLYAGSWVPFWLTTGTAGASEKGELGMGGRNRGVADAAQRQIVTSK